MPEIIVSVGNEKDAEQLYREFACTELIRCRDCKYGTATKNNQGEEAVSCWHPFNYIESDWLLRPDYYCADGEPKEKEGGGE